ncbi:primase-helicase family protein [Zhengella sp. ZM62]|uniref:primase-helicase family protein n=1 Tax=Zhengella sedimenti TaxID=3390035 RepID=UPI0039749793
MTSRDEDPFTEALHELLWNHAYVPSEDRIYPVSTRDGSGAMSVKAARQLYMPSCKVVVGSRGGEKKFNPVDAWLSSPDRIAVSGVRCAPGKPSPLFEDGEGNRWINTFRAPDWQGAGTTRPFERLMESLLPVPVERKWFLQAMAHKLRHPEVPGPAIIFVAQNHGTGRGTLFDILRRFWGNAATRELPFSTFTGKTYQSQYNEWMVGTVMIFINESSEASDGSTYRTRSNTYEHLKETVDPRVRSIQVRVKGRDNFWAETNTSFLIATNHLDALPIPDNDRRFAILTNGEKLSAALAAEIREWMVHDGNMAALNDYLGSIDLAGFDPYAPPPSFAGRQTMVAAAKSALDEAVEAAIAEFPADVFTLEQVVDWIRANWPSSDLPHAWQQTVRRMIQSHYVRVGKKHQTGYYVMIDGKRRAAYAKTREAAARWRGDARLRAAIEKNDAVIDTATAQFSNSLARLARKNSAVIGPPAAGRSGKTERPN